jgi:hypothetical protein
MIFILLLQPGFKKNQAVFFKESQKLNGKPVLFLIF